MALTLATFTNGTNAAPGATATISNVMVPSGAVMFLVGGWREADDNSTIVSALYNTSESFGSPIADRLVTTEFHGFLFYLATPTAGTRDVVVVCNEATHHQEWMAIVVTGHDAGTPYDGLATPTFDASSTTPAISVTTATGDLALGMLVHRNTNRTTTADSGDNQSLIDFDESLAAAGAGVHVSLSTCTGNGAVTPSYVLGATTGGWAMFGLNLNVAVATLPVPKVGGRRLRSLVHGGLAR